jgi:hypothetical protein
MLPLCWQPRLGRQGFSAQSIQNWHACCNGLDTALVFFKLDCTSSVGSQQFLCTRRNLREKAQIIAYISLFKPGKLARALLFCALPPLSSRGAKHQLSRKSAIMQLLRSHLLVLAVLVLFCIAGESKGNGWVCSNWSPPWGDASSSAAPGTRIGSTTQPFRHL